MIDGCPLQNVDTMVIFEVVLLQQACDALLVGYCCNDTVTCSCGLGKKIFVGLIKLFFTPFSLFTDYFMAIIICSNIINTIINFVIQIKTQ